MSARRLPLALLMLLPRLLPAQGTTTAAMQGAVTEESGAPIQRAIVRVTNESNGRRWEVSTRSGGRFFFEDLAVGGPYRIDVRALGFVPEIRSDIRLSLGERIDTHFALKPAAVALLPVTVTANTDATLNSGRIGPAEIVSRSQITKTPNLGRGFLTLTALSPQTIISPSSGTGPTGGITIAGQNRLLNGFSVDGGTNQDLYTGGLPGRETLPQPISLESIEEIQVLPAPFDIRYGGFAGGLVNAVTRSGENAVHGSLFGLIQNSALTGTGVSGKLADFKTWQYGGSVGGPIVRDRAHYFVSLDMQQRAVPDPGPLLTAATVPDPGQVTYADAVRFQTILRDTFNLEPGTLGAVSGRQPVSDIFGKIDVQLGTNSHVEISQHYARGERDGFPGRRAGLYVLSNTGQTTLSTARSSTFIWSRVFAQSWSSEFIVSYLRLNDQCRPAANYPAITVVTAGGELWGGSQASCPTSSLVQNVSGLTENVTVGIGGHTVTLGMHGESLRFSNALGGGGTRGAWTFLSLDDFAARRGSRYSRTLPGSAPAARSDVDAAQISAYAQDRWMPTARLAVTLGLRLDRHFLRNPVVTNEALKTALGIDSGRLPGGSAIFSPRLGINYDLHGDGRGYLRGGIGLFAGRVPYVWLASAYRDNGAQELFLVCAGARVPVFDPIKQPTDCTSAPGPTTRLSFFDAGLKLPQSLKFALGVDHQLAGGIVGTVDLLYNRSLHEFYLTDANLVGPVGVARGEGNRTLYGSINSAGVATPARLAPALVGQVARISNKSMDNTFSLSAQLRKRFGETLETNAFYAFTRARDQMSLVNFNTRQNLEQTPLDGTLENRALRPSYFEVPHRVQLSATTQLSYGVGLSLLYMGSSGTPYTYVITGDPNADGIPTTQLTSDIMYIPMDSTDIALTNPARWAELNSVIEAEPCLRRHRGQILARNSCRNPWFGTLNARLSKEFPTAAGQSIELTANVYNALNLLNRRWGLYRVTTPTPAWPMMRLRGYDTTLQRGIYDLTLPSLRNVQDLDGRWSRWLAELGVRSTF